MIKCGIRNRLCLLPDRYSCRAKWTSWVVVKGALTVISSKECQRIVGISRTFSTSRCTDPIVTIKACHSSLVRNGRSKSNTQIRESTPSLNLHPHSGKGYRVRIPQMIARGHLAQLLPPLGCSNLTFPRIVLMPKKTRRSLHTMVGHYKIMHGVGTTDSPQTFQRSLRNNSQDIRPCSVPISSFFSKYHPISCIFGPTCTTR